MIQYRWEGEAYFSRNNDYWSPTRMHSRNIKSEITSLMENVSSVPEASIHWCFLYLLSLLCYSSSLTETTTQNFSRGRLCFPVMPAHLQLCVPSETGIKTPARGWCFIPWCLQSDWMFPGMRVQRSCPAPVSASFAPKRSLAQFCASPGECVCWTHSPPPRSPT